MGDQLKPFEFQPGKSGNPSGRPKLTEDEILMRQNFRAALATLGTKTIAEIQAIAKDPNQPAAFALQAKALEWFYKKGNPAFYKEFHDRVLGKAIQGIELSGPGGAPIQTENFSQDQLKKMAEEVLKKE